VDGEQEIVASFKFRSTTTLCELDAKSIQSSRGGSSHLGASRAQGLLSISTGTCFLRLISNSLGALLCFRFFFVFLCPFGSLPERVLPGEFVIRLRSSRSRLRVRHFTPVIVHVTISLNLCMRLCPFICLTTLWKRNNQNSITVLASKCCNGREAVQCMCLQMFLKRRMLYV
jgi:hypothetical protein